jgi:hypothetical protein
MLLHVRLTPRAGKDCIDGVKETPEGAYVQARVRAVPEDGKANTALIEVLAKAIGVPKSSLSVSSGASSRLKTVLIAGDRTALEKRLKSWLEGLK